MLYRRAGSCGVHRSRDMIPALLLVVLFASACGQRGWVVSVSIVQAGWALEVLTFIASFCYGCWMAASERDEPKILALALIVIVYSAAVVASNIRLAVCYQWVTSDPEAVGVSLCLPYTPNRLDEGEGDSDEEDGGGGGGGGSGSGSGSGDAKHAAAVDNHLHSVALLSSSNANHSSSSDSAAPAAAGVLPPLAPLPARVQTPSGMIIELKPAANNNSAPTTADRSSTRRKRQHPLITVDWSTDWCFKDRFYTHLLSVPGMVYTILLVSVEVALQINSDRSKTIEHGWLGLTSLYVIVMMLGPLFTAICTALLYRTKWQYLYQNDSGTAAENRSRPIPATEIALSVSAPPALIGRGGGSGGGGGDPEDEPIPTALPPTHPYRQSARDFDDDVRGMPRRSSGGGGGGGGGSNYPLRFGGGGDGEDDGAGGGAVPIDPVDQPPSIR